MKKMIIALVALFAFVASAQAMSYEQARQQALFLTDKMAYELNLTEEQYEAAYEINLDYLMGVNTQADLYGTYWERRNLDLGYILLDWQYRLYLDATYFYRPLYWSGGYWHFGIYARYPHRDYFYFGVPRFYAVYRGGHSWHRNGGRSWYHGRTFAPSGRSRTEHFGMHNRFQRGDYGRGHSIGRNDAGRNNRNFGGSRSSSTRTTVNGSHDSRSHSSTTTSTRRNFGGSVPRNTFTPSNSGSSHGSSTSGRSFGGSRSSGSSSVGSSSHGSTSRSSSAPSRSFGGSRSSSGGGSRSSGGSHGGGGGHFGGRR